MQNEQEDIIFQKLTNIFNLASKISKNTFCEKKHNIEKVPEYCWVCWSKTDCPKYLSDLIIKEIKNDNRTRLF